MNPETISQKHLTQQLLDLGVIRGGVLLVHCSFSRLKPIDNGPLGLILALQAALGPEGGCDVRHRRQRGGGEDDGQPGKPRWPRSSMAREIGMWAT